MTFRGDDVVIIHAPKPIYPEGEDTYTHVGSRNTNSGVHVSLDDNYMYIHRAGGKGGNPSQPKSPPPP